VGITAGSREVPGRKGLWQEASIITIIIIIILLLLLLLLFLKMFTAKVQELILASTATQTRDSRIPDVQN
jgi:hypothetical protein